MSKNCAPFEPGESPAGRFTNRPAGGMQGEFQGKSEKVGASSELPLVFSFTG
jgi:hypothetical protein